MGASVSRSRYAKPRAAAPAPAWPQLRTCACVAISGGMGWLSPSVEVPKILNAGRAKCELKREGGASFMLADLIVGEVWVDAAAWSAC